MLDIAPELAERLAAYAAAHGLSQSGAVKKLLALAVQGDAATPAP